MRTRAAAPRRRRARFLRQDLGPPVLGATVSIVGVPSESPASAAHVGVRRPSPSRSKRHEQVALPNRPAPVLPAAQERPRRWRRALVSLLSLSLKDPATHQSAPISKRHGRSGGNVPSGIVSNIIPERSAR